MSEVDEMFDRHCLENRQVAESERMHLAVAQVEELLDLASRLERDRKDLMGALRALRKAEVFDDDDPRLVLARNNTDALLSRMEKT